MRKFWKYFQARNQGGPRGTEAPSNFSVFAKITRSKKNQKNVKFFLPKIWL